MNCKKILLYYDNCHCRKNTCSESCTKRMFRDNSKKFVDLVANIKSNNFEVVTKAILENCEETKYKNYNYNASFHKGLPHNLTDGRLISSKDYETMKQAIYCNDQNLLMSVPLAKNSSTKLVSPLASWSTIPIGLPQHYIEVPEPPTLSSAAGAAEMLEIYANAIARDVPFIDYDTDETIKKLLQATHLNNIFIISNLKNIPNAPFTPKTIFRGNSSGCIIGPYVSQLLYLNITAGALRSKQTYFVPPTRAEALANNFRVEWGVTLEETINIQNGNLNLLPPATPADKMVYRYLYSGRALAEAVHADPVYQFFYHAALLLSSLGAKPNPGMPVYPNQGSFVTAGGPASLQCTIGEVTGSALKHCWYWKWQHFRNLRPETFGLWVHDIISELVPNQGNFDISDNLLKNPILNDIYNINNSWVPNSKSYTLPQAYREGAPLHPAYLSGHATIAGACCTILKIYYDGEQKWLDLPGVISGAQGGIANNMVQANSDGTSLVAYNNADAVQATVGTEINKLASNVAIGRNFAGIHYRSDAIIGIKLGEIVAIHYMEDILSTMVENMPNGKIPEITFRKFDGELVTIKPTLCLNS